MSEKWTQKEIIIFFLTSITSFFIKTLLLIQICVILLFLT